MLQLLPVRNVLILWLCLKYAAATVAADNAAETQPQQRPAGDVVSAPGTIDDAAAAVSFVVYDNDTMSSEAGEQRRLPHAATDKQQQQRPSSQSSQQQQQQSQQHVLSRRKRFVAFPVGSSFSCAVCMTTGVLGNPNYQYLSMGLNWGIAYDLPNATWALAQSDGLRTKFAGGAESADASGGAGAGDGDGGGDAGTNKGVFSGTADMLVELPTIKRRHRRELYGKLETLISSMGYNGRDCVLRALCESRQYFQKTKMGMLGEMLRIIFSLPKQRIFTRELREFSDIELYDHAYRKARSVDCVEQYDCSFSLLELAFGKYSAPPPGYFENH